MLIKPPKYFRPIYYVELSFLSPWTFQIIKLIFEICFVHVSFKLKCAKLHLYVKSQITLFIELQALSSKLYSSIAFFYQFVSLFMWNLLYSLKKMSRETNLFYSCNIWDLIYKWSFRQKWTGLFIEIAWVLIEVIF